jgi:hypothetical protein
MSLRRLSPLALLFAMIAFALPEGAAAQKTNILNDWMSNPNPGAFPPHLHSMTEASWKDASGVQFDEWLG